MMELDDNRYITGREIIDGFARLKADSNTYFDENYKQMILFKTVLLKLDATTSDELKMLDKESTKMALETFEKMENKIN